MNTILNTVFLTIRGYLTPMALLDAADKANADNDVEWCWFLRGVSERRAGLRPDSSAAGQYATHYTRGFRCGLEPVLTLGEAPSGVTGEVILVNALSLNMISPETQAVTFHADRVNAHVAAGACDVGRFLGRFTQGIGHADTARLVGDAFGFPVTPTRATVRVNRGDLLVVAQYVGPRLPEGATELPEGARIDYFLVACV